MVSGAISGVFKSPPFSPHSAWSQGCQYISTFLVFQKSDQICLSASKLLGKSLPWIRKSRNRFIVGCRGKCGVRWYQVPHCSVHGQPRANPECSRAREALKTPLFFFVLLLINGLWDFGILSMLNRLFYFAFIPTEQGGVTVSHQKMSDWYE